MARFFAFLLWTLVFVALLLVIDQAFVRIPTELPGLAQAQRFYLDFRRRVLALPEQKPDLSIEGLIERDRPVPAKPAPAARKPAAPPAAETPPPPPPAPAKTPAPAAKPAAGFVYADAQGELHMVERFEQVPQRFRASAQPLGQ